MDLLGDVIAGSSRRTRTAQFELRPFSEIEETLVEWLWDQRIPIGMLTGIVGDEGNGKTALALALLKQARAGELPGDRFGHPLRVAIVAPEDDASSVLKPRLLAAGIDINDDGILHMSSDDIPSLPGDTNALVDTLLSHNVELLFIDPLVSLLANGTDNWKDTSVRAAFQPLLVGASSHGITTIGIQHTNKGSGETARERSSGTTGWRQLYRSQLMLGPDPRDENSAYNGARCLVHAKTNHSARQRTLEVKLNSIEHTVKDRTIRCVVAQIGDETDVTEAEVLTVKSSKTMRAEKPLFDYTKLIRVALPCTSMSKAATLCGGARYQPGSPWRDAWDSLLQSGEMQHVNGIYSIVPLPGAAASTNPVY